MQAEAAILHMMPFEGISVFLKTYNFLYKRPIFYHFCEQTLLTLRHPHQEGVSCSKMHVKNTIMIP